MNPKQILELVVRVEDAYDEMFDDDRKSRWKRALADADAGAISRALETWIGAAEKWKAPTPRDLINAAPTPARSSSEPIHGKRESTSYFRQGVVRDDAGEIATVVFSDGGGWWLKPVEHITGADIMTIANRRDVVAHQPR